CYGTPTVMINGVAAMVGNGGFIATITLTHEGTNTICAVATDMAGNIGTTSSYCLMDTTPPRLWIGTPGTGEILGTGTVVVSGTVSESYGTPTVMINGVAAMVGNGEFIATITLTHEGTNIICAVAKDIAGNIGTTSSMVILDTTPPRLWIGTPETGEILGTGTMVVSGTVTECYGTPTVMINGIAAMVGNGGFIATITLTHEGTNTIHAVTTDTVGNMGTTSSYVILDTIPPRIWMSTLQADNIFGTRTVTISGTILECYGTPSVVINGIAAMVDNGRFIATITLTHEGTNTICAMAEDTVGNMGTASTYVFLDTSPPVQGEVLDGFGEDIDITSASSYLAGNWSQWKDDESGILRYECSIGSKPGKDDIVDWQDAGTKTSWMATQLPLVGSRTYYFNVKGINRAGRCSVVASNGVMVLNIRLKSPDYVRDGLEGDIDYLGTTSVVYGNWSNVDLQGRKFEYYYALGDLFGGFVIPWTCCGTKTSITAYINLKHGLRYYLFVKVMDEDGFSSSESSSDGFVVDLTPPNLSWIKDGLWVEDIDYQTSTTLFAHWADAIDAESMIKEYQYRVPGVTDWTQMSSLTQVVLPNICTGAYHFELKAINVLGLESGVIRSDGVVVDQTPPSKIGWINDGLSGIDVDWISTKEYLSCNFATATDAESGIYRYWYCLGTTPGDSNIASWQQAGGTSTTIANHANIQAGTRYYFNIRTENYAGLLGEIESSNGFRIDTSPPTGLMVSDEGNFSTNSSCLRFYWQARDDESGVAGYYYRVGDKEWTSVGTQTCAKVRDDFKPGQKYYCEIKAVNNAGLYTIGKSDGIVIETTPPLGTPTSPQPISVYSLTNTITLNWDSVGLIDEESGIISYELEMNDGQRFKTQLTSIQVFGTQNYPYQSRVRAINGAGFYGQWSDWGNIVAIDLDSPRSEIQSGFEQYWQNQPTTITVTAADTLGLREVRLCYAYSNDGNIYTAWQSYGIRSVSGTHTTAGFMFDYPIGDGYYRFISQAMDVAGRIEELKDRFELMLGIDSQPPQSYCLPIIQYCQKRDMTVGYNATDNLSLKEVRFYYDYSRNGSDWSGYRLYGVGAGPCACPLSSGSFEFKEAEEGYYRFYAQTIDLVGNVEEMPIGYDTGCLVKDGYPQSWIMGMDKYWHNSSTNVTIMATDTVGLEEIRLYYKLASEENWTLFGTTSLTGTSSTRVFSFGTGKDGVYELCSQAKNIANLIEQVESKIEIGYDMTPPVISHLGILEGEVIEGGKGCTLSWAAKDNVKLGTITIFYLTDMGKVVILETGDDSGTYSWKSPTESSSTFKLMCQAYDRVGNCADISINLVIDTTPPMIERVWEWTAEDDKDIDVDIDVDYLLRWDRAIDAESKILYYDVHEAEDGKGFRFIGTTSGYMYSIDHKKEQEKHDYRYKVMAVNQVGLRGGTVSDGIRIVDKIEDISTDASKKIVYFNEQGKTTIIQLPKGAFDKKAMVIIRVLKDPASGGLIAKAPLLDNLKLLNGSLRQITAIDEGNNLLEPVKDIEVVISYEDEDKKDEIRDSFYRIYKLRDGKWELAEGSQRVNAQEDNITLVTNSLSIFGIFGPGSLLRDRIIGDDVYPWPNPYKPSRHKDGMRWWGMPDMATLRIWTISGELIYDSIVNPDANSVLEFKDADNLPSGIYIFVIIDRYGGCAKGKFGVIR
ncbi:fibronectin type III domain-containing protein, partial [bacterium]|nr:fibronectin type III domain-containing protein [bacterium]